MVADGQELSAESILTLHTFLKDEAVLIVGVGLTGEAS